MIVRLLNGKAIVPSRSVLCVMNYYACLNLLNYCTNKKKEIPKNTYGDLYSATEQTENGEVYDKKPFKITLEAGRQYSWCLCGKSHNQPFCDGTHKDIFLKIKQRPIRFKVEETKDYWLCNCKQTTHRPFCDGTHKNPEIQQKYTKV